MRGREEEVKVEKNGTGEREMSQERAVLADKHIQIPL